MEAWSDMEACILNPDFGGMKGAAGECSKTFKHQDPVL